MHFLRRVRYIPIPRCIFHIATLSRGTSSSKDYKRYYCSYYTMTADTTTTITTTTTADAAPSPPPPRANIAIVGGGIAGLRAAQTLLSTSTHLHVTILEARNRLGGRIHSVPVPGTDDAWVDMGPNWLHGASTHPLLPLLKAEAGKRRETVVVDVEDLIGGAGYIPPPHDPSSPVKREDREKWEKDAAEMDALTWEVIGAAVGYSRMYYYAGRDEKSRVGVLEEKKENMLADENEDKKMVVEKEWDFEIDPRWSLLDFCDVMAEGKFGPLPSGESILSEHGLQDKPAEEGDNSREAKADEIWKREKLRILHFLHQNELLPTSPTPTPCPQRHHLLLDMMTMFSSYVGTHVSRQSLRNMLLEAGPGDDSNLFVASTYRSILEYVEANIREKMQNGKNGEVRLCRKAVGVRNLYAQGNREGGVVVRVKKVDADGNEEGKEEELHFDACILTLRACSL